MGRKSEILKLTVNQEHLCQFIVQAGGSHCQVHQRRRFRQWRLVAFVHHASPAVHNAELHHSKYPLLIVRHSVERVSSREVELEFRCEVWPVPPRRKARADEAGQFDVKKVVGWVGGHVVPFAGAMYAMNNWYPVRDRCQSPLCRRSSQRRYRARTRTDTPMSLLIRRVRNRSMRGSPAWRSPQPSAAHTWTRLSFEPSTDSEAHGNSRSCSGMALR